MFKKLGLVMVITCILGTSACHQKESPNTIKVGVIAGPEVALMRVAQRVAKQRYGLNVKIVVFSDYNLPNTALADGSIEANAFQHQPYLESQVQAYGYKIAPVAKTFLYPMALYSAGIHKLSQLKQGAMVGIPNDPSNEARALLLLQSARLIRLRPHANINATPLDIVSNPKKLHFIALDAAELPRALNSLSLAAINTNYALAAGLLLSQHILFKEAINSPYVDIIAVRSNEVHLKKIRELIASYQSQPVIKKANTLFGDAAVPGFTIVENNHEN